MLDNHKINNSNDRALLGTLYAFGPMISPLPHCNSMRLVNCTVLISQVKKWRVRQIE